MASARPRPYGVGAYSAGAYERYPATFIISSPCSVGVWAPAGLCGGDGMPPRLTTKPRPYGVASYGAGAYERSPGASNLWRQPAPCSPGIWIKPGATPNLPRGFGAGPFGTNGFGA